ncbi:MAG: NAD-dependent protein deacylase [Clostridia bacterium]|nr:NAD-dependent protein deacylase [Clostridia bacterium]
MTPLETLQQYIDRAERIVFFGGAGVSTESGVPDFRSVDGLYHQKWDYPPETILSHTFFVGQTGEFYRFYKEKMLCLDVRPNAAHKKLARLEAAGKLSAVITQNIDGLHQAAGSKNVLELHGSVHRNYCRRCRKAFDAQYMKNAIDIPLCDACGSVIKPDVVLYEESLNGDTIEAAVAALQRADLLIIGGTSLAVYPAAGLIRYYRGGPIVLLNRDETPYDYRADLCIREPIGQVLEQVEVR